jgi:hypothetical protein
MTAKNKDLLALNTNQRLAYYSYMKYNADATHKEALDNAKNTKLRFV